MSIYSLENNEAFKYYAEHRQKLKSFSDKEYANTYFLIGEKINKREQNFSQVMVEMLCTENCELINYINDTLNGKFTKKAKPIKLIDNGVDYGEDNNAVQIFNTDMIWGDDDTNGTQW